MLVVFYSSVHTPHILASTYEPTIVLYILCLFMYALFTHLYADTRESVSLGAFNSNHINYFIFYVRFFFFSFLCRLVCFCFFLLILFFNYLNAIPESIEFSVLNDSKRTTIWCKVGWLHNKCWCSRFAQRFLVECGPIWWFALFKTNCLFHKGKCSSRFKCALCIFSSNN